MLDLDKLLDKLTGKIDISEEERNYLIWIIKADKEILSGKKYRDVYRKILSDKFWM